MVDSKLKLGACAWCEREKLTVEMPSNDSGFNMDAMIGHLDRVPPTFASFAVVKVASFDQSASKRASSEARVDGDEAIVGCVFDRMREGTIEEFCLNDSRVSICLLYARPGSFVRCWHTYGSQVNPNAYGSRR